MTPSDLDRLLAQVIDRIDVEGIVRIVVGKCKEGENAGKPGPCPSRESRESSGGGSEGGEDVEQPYPKRHWTATMNRHWEASRKATAQYERADAALTKAKRDANKIMARLGPNHEESKAASRKVQAAQQEKVEAKKRIAEARVAARKALIKVIKPDEAAVVEATNPLHPDIAQSVNEGNEFVGQVLSSSICKKLSVQYVRGRQGSVNKSYGGKVRISPDSSADSVVHELGHEIEDQAGVKQATAAFLKRRCGNEKATRIRDVYPDDVEIPKSISGRKDEFDRYFEGSDAYYVGRKYTGGSTEIISMGLQAVYNDPAGFAKADPDFFDFIVDILAGKHNERAVTG